MASSTRLRLSTSALVAYRALRRSLRASDIDDKGLVQALSSEFRRLLREEEKEKEKESGKAEGSSTSTAAAAAPPTPAPAPTASLAFDLAFLLSAVKHQRDLLLSYDIGVDRETRQMETVRRTAARVGLRLPERGGAEAEGGE